LPKAKDDDLSLKAQKIKKEIDKARTAAEDAAAA
jgi:hypothetical protein